MDVFAASVVIRTVKRNLPETDRQVDALKLQNMLIHIPFVAKVGSIILFHAFSDQCVPVGRQSDFGEDTSGTPAVEWDHVGIIASIRGQLGLEET